MYSKVSETFKLILLPVDILLCVVIDDCYGGSFVCEDLIKIGDVFLILTQSGNKRRIVTFLNQLFLIQAGQPWMRNHFLAAATCAQSLGGVLAQQFRDEILAVLRNRDLVAFEVRELNFSCLYHFVHLFVVLVIGVKWRTAHEQLVTEDTDSPPIDWERVPLFSENFRGKIIRSPAESLCLLPLVEYFGQTEISET